MEDVYNSADVAELADARGSGPRSRKGVEVQVLSSAPTDSPVIVFHSPSLIGTLPCAGPTDEREFARNGRQLANQEFQPRLAR